MAEDPTIRNRVLDLLIEGPPSVDEKKLEEKRARAATLKALQGG